MWDMIKETAIFHYRPKADSKSVTYLTVWDGDHLLLFKTKSFSKKSLCRKWMLILLIYYSIW